MMKMKKRSVFVAAALAAMMLMAGCGQVKIGCVDEDRIAKEAPQIKATLEEGNAKLLEEQKALQEKMAQNPDMSKEEAQKVQKEAQIKAVALQQQYMTQIKQKVDAALADVSKEKKLDAVVTTDATQKSVMKGCEDLTDVVIQKLQ